MNKILKDTDFNNGFYIGHIDSTNHPNTNTLWKFNDKEPSWKICQWFSNFSLQDNNKKESTPNYQKIFNEQKSVTRNKDGSLILEIYTFKEYKHDRLENEAWPHLLIEQFFEEVYLYKLTSFNVLIDFDFISFKNHMINNNDLHTFQITWYFCISNINKNSKGYKDFFWFGLPFIDTPRLPIGKPYEAQDYGKEDSTGKYIINIDLKNDIKSPILVGDNIKYSNDILPNLKKAFEMAKKKGFLKTSNYEDMGLISTNFGIEDTGTFDGTIKINKINIYE